MLAFILLILAAFVFACLCVYTALVGGEPTPPNRFIGAGTHLALCLLSVALAVVKPPVMPTVGSLFTGAAGMDRGFVAAGFTVRWQCENDPTCRAVLARHYPDIRNRYGDIQTVNWENVERVDAVIGGFTCQDVSQAGLRGGLNGTRSNLFFAFAHVCRTIRPTFAVIENVEGLLSSHNGRDMATVLWTLQGIGAVDIGWAVLDAQWFHTPQRRRRVYLVVDFAGERASEILALPESVSGDVTPRRTKEHHLTGVPDDTPHTRRGTIALTLTAHGAKGGDPTTEPYIPAPHPITGLPGLRALTPLENERLMTWPDGWTKYGDSDKVLADYKRRKMTGNGVVSSVTEYIARRMIGVMHG